MTKTVVALLPLSLWSFVWGQTPSSDPNLGSPSIASQYLSDTQGMAINDLVQSVLSGNKDLQGARQQLQQAEARLLQSGFRLNPIVDATYNTDRFTTNSGSGGYNVTYTQPFELGGKRVKRVRVAELAVEMARAQIADAERLATAQVRTLYGEGVAAATRLRLLEGTSNLNQQMLRIMQVQLKAGDASRLDQTLLQASANQIEAQRLQAENQIAGFFLQIKALTGNTGTDRLQLRGLPESPAIPFTEEAALSLALENRPDLKAARIREQMAEAGIDLARAQIIPNVNGFVRYSKDAMVLDDLPRPGDRYVDNGRSLTFGVSIPLPLFNRQQGIIAESVSQRTQARAQREGAEVSVRRDVAVAYRNYEAARRTLEVLRTGVVGQNQESFQIVRLAYQLGELRLLDVVNQQRILIDAQTAYATAQRDFYTALASLESALGHALAPNQP